jgi:hypothetical protein
VVSQPRRHSRQRFSCGFKNLPGRIFLDLDLKKLKARAFDRAEWAEEALRRYHSALQNLNVVEVEPLRELYRWMLISFSLRGRRVRSMEAEKAEKACV